MLKIGLCGVGTIGSGVYEIVSSLKDSSFEIIKVFDREDEEKRRLYGEKFTTNLDDILLNDEIDIVVETCGGLEFPYNLIKKALENKKHVVSANKEVVSEYLEELVKLANDNNVKFFFEASVGGGIPIIHEICKSSKFDRIDYIYGILNGTTNFILSKVFNDNKDFDSALLEAQRLGFAERDPSNDILGKDLYRKIRIVSMLSTNKRLSFAQEKCLPIKGLPSEFIDYAKENDMVIKYIAMADLKKNEISVEPVMISKNHVLASTDGALNKVVVGTKFNGELTFSGFGAGKLPTACSLVKDLYEILNDNNYVSYNPLDKIEVNKNANQLEYYVLDQGFVILANIDNIDELNKEKFAIRKL